MPASFRCQTLAALAASCALLAPAATAEPLSHFEGCSPQTAASASLVLPSTSPSSIALNPGDELAVFTPGGVCAGAAVWTGETVAVSIWADDPTTEEAEGFAAGEPLSFRVWQSATGTEIADEGAVSASYDDAYDPSGAFSLDAVFVVNELVVQPVTSAEEDGSIRELALEANFPNPFRRETTISFALPSPAHVTLEVFDVMGRKIATLMDEQRDRGRHEAIVDGTGLPSGTYFYRLNTEAAVAQRKMTLIQ